MSENFIKKLAVAISFFYSDEKLQYLNKTLSNLHKFSKDVG